MKRSKDSQIVKSIWRELNREPQTIAQISNRTKINWETVKNFITVLDTINLLKKKHIKSKVKYCSFKLKIDMRTKEEILSELNLKRLSGSANKCICGKSGEFGSIISFEEYIICGWCGTISIPNKNSESPEKTKGDKNVKTN